MRFIDSHSHTYFPQFDIDRDAMYERMRTLSVQTIAVGTQYATSRMAVQSSIDVPNVVCGATIGVHPHEAREGFTDTDFESLFLNDERAEGAPPLVVGVGECGLDYFRDVTETEKQKQREVFAAQIAFAVRHDLPLMLHVRPAKGTHDAHSEVLDMLKQAQGTHGERVRGTSHFFTASYEVAKQYWGLGFATSFPGVITFAKETEEAVREAPHDLMLAETDAPYAAPVPHRGERNEPVFIQSIVDHIARVRGEEVELVASQLVSNTQRIFNIV
jgi:TatD DNase family protein